MLKGKTVVLGVSGGIAAYKIASLASMLVKQHANVRVIMTQNATNFITPTTFETLTGQKCLVDTFDRNFEFQVEHVSLAKQADIFMIAPATANVIAKVAHGLADDMLTTTFLACKKPENISLPAMNIRCTKTRSRRTIWKSAENMACMSLTRRAVTWPAATPEPERCRSRRLYLNTF